MDVADWGLCSRCGVALAEGDVEEPLLCGPCRKHMKAVGDTAASLAETLMDWGRQHEWAGTSPEVLIDAVELAAPLFVHRINTNRPLADGPKLLATSMEADEVVLTLGLSSSAVWRETFGSWESGHPRVIFLTSITNPGRSGEEITVYYWDRQKDRAASRTAWTDDDSTVGEFNECVRTRSWGAPRFEIVVRGLEEAKLKSAPDAISRAASALGLHPFRGRTDKAGGALSTEVFGELTPRRRRDLPNLLRQVLEDEDFLVEFEE